MTLASQSSGTFFQLRAGNCHQTTPQLLSCVNVSSLTSCLPSAYVKHKAGPRAPPVAASIPGGLGHPASPRPGACKAEVSAVHAAGRGATLPGGVSASITLTGPPRQRMTSSAVCHLSPHKLFRQTRCGHSFANLTMRGNKVSGPTSSRAAAPGSAGWGGHAESACARRTLCVPKQTRRQPGRLREAAHRPPRHLLPEAKPGVRDGKHIFSAERAHSAGLTKGWPVTRRSPRNRGNALHR